MQKSKKGNHKRYIPTFRKSFFCLALYTEEVNLQTVVIIKCTIICRNYVCKTKVLFLSLVLKNSNVFTFVP